VVREFFGASVRLVPVDGSGHVLVPVRREAAPRIPGQELESLEEVEQP
jgi:hypothetical protein